MKEYYKKVMSAFVQSSKCLLFPSSYMLFYLKDKNQNSLGLGLSTVVQCNSVECGEP